MWTNGDIVTWQGADGSWRLGWFLQRDTDGRQDIVSLAQFMVSADERPQTLSDEDLANLRTLPRLGHFPILAERVMEADVQLVGRMQPQEEDMQGYRLWRAAFERNEAGVFSLPLDEVLATVLAGMPDDAE